MNIILDKSTFQLLSLVISASGLLAALIHYKSPEAEEAFWGDNPFVVKKHAIDNTLKYSYALWTLAGFLIQGILIVFAPGLKQRNHQTGYYFILCLLFVVFSYVIIKLLAKLGKHIAKREWFPEVVNSYRRDYEEIKDIIDHQGLRSEQYQKINELQDVDRCREKNFQWVDERMELLRKLFDLKWKSGNRCDRLFQLKEIFEN